MSGVAIGAIILVVLLVLVICGCHVAYALALLSAIGVIILTGNFSTGISILGTAAFEAVRGYTFGILPLFMLMGVFLSKSGAGADLYDFAHVLLKRVKGGLAHTTVVANAIFAAATGSSLASVSLFTKVAYPEMKRKNYDKKFALGTVAGTAVLGMLIPPSNLMILYGILSQESIGKLFLAGVMPGILLSALFCIMIVIVGKVRPEWVGARKTDLNAEKDDFSEEKKMNAKEFILKPLPIIALIVLVLGGIYGGFFTPTEAGAFGAAGAMILAFIRGMTMREFFDGLVEAASSSCTILFLMIAGSMFARMLSLSGLVQFVSAAIVQWSLPTPALLFLFIVIILILGAFMDSSSIMMITMPLMVPVCTVLGLDLIWFGIVIIIAVEMGLLTPPFGILVFSVKSIVGDDCQLGDIFKGSMLYLVCIAVCVIILIFAPRIVTWLPSLM